MKCAECGHLESEHHVDPDDGPVCDAPIGPSVPSRLGGSMTPICGRCTFVPHLQAVAVTG